jgi:hypothetical protein
VEQLKSYWFVNPNGVGFLEERRLLCDITTALDAAKKEAYEQGRQDERNAERGLV